ncbi:glycosyltransferase [Patescibacteria group bacterium]|nr:glycosyltransferase [Patescibacteria group bacterium]
MKNLHDIKIAIVHDQLTQYGGAEKTLEALLAIFPQADIYTGVFKPINISQNLLKRQIISGKLPDWLGFLLPLVFEGFDLRKYDLIISEGTAWPKGVLTNPTQLHISYIYTPPRFLYGYATEGQRRDKWYYKPFLKIVDHFLLMWDYSAAQRPDFILSISQETAKRVKKFYKRDSQVIYPPVDVQNELRLSTEASADNNQAFYLCISRLAAYKNIDLLIQAVNQTTFKLKIAGTGKEEDRLKELAGNNVELLGFVTDAEKSRLLATCRGLIFPTDQEDFGIVPVEALAYGKPVLCHRSGGPLETVVEGETGLFFDDLAPAKLAEKLSEFDKNITAGVYKKEKAIETAKKFSVERFKQEFFDFTKQKWEEKQHAGTT